MSVRLCSRYGVLIKSYGLMMEHVSNISTPDCTILAIKNNRPPGGKPERVQRLKTCKKIIISAPNLDRK